MDTRFPRITPDLAWQAEASACANMMLDDAGETAILTHAELRCVRRGEYDMGMPAAFEKWTVDLLDALPESSERFELVDGELYVTPSPAIPHQRAVLRLGARLLAYTSETGVGETIISPSDVWRERRQENRVQPDVYVVRFDDGRLPPYPFHLSALMLAVEVVSPGNPRLDYDIKRRLYQEAGVPAYWIVDLEKRWVTTFTGAPGGAVVHDQRVRWMSAGASHPFELRLQEFFDECLR